MSKSIDPLKKIRYKQSRLKGENIKQSLIQAGYTERTAHQSSTNSIVKCCEQELKDEVKASDITVEWVIKRLTTELKATDCKASDRIRIAELLGKYLNMFKDTQTQGVMININDTLEKLRGNNTQQVVEDNSRLKQVDDVNIHTT